MSEVKLQLYFKPSAWDGGSSGGQIDNDPFDHSTKFNKKLNHANREISRGRCPLSSRVTVKNKEKYSKFDLIFGLIIRNYSKSSPPSGANNYVHPAFCPPILRCEKIMPDKVPDLQNVDRQP